MSLRAAGALALLALPVASAAVQEPAPAGAVTRICLAPASVEAAPNGVDPVAAVSTAFSTFLNGPTLTVEALRSRLQSQARQEAKLGGCEFLLLTSVKHERKTGGGILRRMAGGAVQQGAWSVTGSVGGSMAGRVAAGAVAGAASSSINDYALSSRQKDDLTLRYRLENAGGKVLVDNAEKKRAKADGEDLLTPIAQKASEAIAAAVAK
jgi:hypothetical protein